MVKDENLQYYVNGEATKISALLSDKLDKYEYKWRSISFWFKSGSGLKIIKEDKFSYPPLGEAIEKQTRTDEDLGDKQIKAIEHQRKKQVNNKYWQKQ